MLDHKDNYNEHAAQTNLHCLQEYRTLTKSSSLASGGKV